MSGESASALDAAETPVKCLLVDDREENLMVLEALLRGPGVELFLARSGADALELLLVHDFALALLDVQMPEMDGFTLAELMRGSERTARVPIIFVTAGSRDQYRLFKGYELGAVDFLYKPIEPMVLQNKAAVFFELYRQRRQLARDLAERTETLRLNELFSAVLGHDLRNPLQTIVTIARVLQRIEDPGQVRDLAARVLASAERMGNLIEGLFDLARARFGDGLELSHTQADLGTIVGRVVQEHQAIFPNRVIELQVTGGSLTGMWDEDRLAQVLSNLVGNALRHGQRDGRVEVGLDGSDETSVRVSVASAGEIPRDVLPALFEPFRGGKRGQQRDGLGLGLYIVKHLVEAHQGTIEVASGSGGTTVFHVTLPRQLQAQ